MMGLIANRLQLLLNAGLLCKVFKPVGDIRGTCRRIAGDVRLFVPSTTGLFLFSGRGGHWVRYKNEEVILESSELEYHSDDDWQRAIAEMKGAHHDTGT